MRPVAMRAFDGLYLGANALGVGASIAAAWRAQALMSSLGTGGGYALGGAVTAATGVHVVMVAGLNLVLWYFISRRGSGAARWVLTVLVAYGLVGLAAGMGFAWLLGMGQAGDLLDDAWQTVLADWTVAVPMVVAVLQLAAVACLFMPGASAWFRERRA